MYAIEINNLTNKFEDKISFNNLSLHVEEGTIYGFIGQNGVGKSTTQIFGLSKQNEGDIKLFDKDNSNSENRTKIGLLIESPAVYPYSSGYLNMEWQAYNLGIKHLHDLIMDCLAKSGLKGLEKKAVKKYSLGMEQRLAIAISLQDFQIRKI